MSDEEIFEDEDEDEELESPSMDPSNPDWSDFVMAQFSEKELVDIEGRKYPNVAGLRRVIQVLMGPIVRSEPVEVVPFNDKRATVSYVVEVYDNNISMARRYGDVADVSSDNCDQMFFQQFAVATASTRAEARCLRKALQLRQAAAEEMNRSRDKQPDAVKPETESKKSMTDSQINFIDIKCKELDINVKKFMNSGTGTYSGVSEVPVDKAKGMVKKLGVYINDSEAIPKSLVGYKENWRD